MRSRALIAALVLLITLPFAAHAAHLATPPLLFDNLPIFFTCAVTNLHSKPVTITSQLIDETGAVTGEETVVLQPGASEGQGRIFGGGFAILRCVFRFRGSPKRVLAAARYDLLDGASPVSSGAIAAVPVPDRRFEDD